MAKKITLLTQRIPEIVRPARIAEQYLEIREADEGRDAVDGIVERQPERFDQRQDHDRRIDDEGRKKEDADMPAHRAPDRNHIGSELGFAHGFCLLLLAEPARRSAGGIDGTAPLIRLQPSRYSDVMLA